MILREWQGKLYMPASDELLYWDSSWYHSIVKNGYQFDSHTQSNSAFFPAFPYVWKFLSLSLQGISVLNAGLFVLSLVSLFTYFPINWQWKLIFLSNPALFFFFIPYSESFFFLFITIFLVGLKKENISLSVTGLLLASLTRPSVLVFIPAFVIVALVYSKERYSKYIVFAFATIAGLAIVTFIQHESTNVLFAFAKAQVHWDHKVRFPEFPFTTWGGSIPLRLDMAAFNFSLLAVVSFVVIVQKKYQLGETPYKEELFSILYIIGITGLLLITQGGSLNSLNRYVFATPFSYIFLRKLASKRFEGWWPYFVLLGMALFCVLLFFKWQSGSEAKKLLFLALYVTSFYFLLWKNKIQRVIFLILFIVNLVIQAYVCTYFFSNEWVG